MSEEFKTGDRVRSFAIRDMVGTVRLAGSFGGHGENGKITVKWDGGVCQTREFPSMLVKIPSDPPEIKFVGFKYQSGERVKWENRFGTIAVTDDGFCIYWDDGLKSPVYKWSDRTTWIERVPSAPELKFTGFTWSDGDRVKYTLSDASNGPYYGTVIITDEEPGFFRVKWDTGARTGTIKLTDNPNYLERVPSCISVNGVNMTGRDFVPEGDSLQDDSACPLCCGRGKIPSSKLGGSWRVCMRCGGRGKDTLFPTFADTRDKQIAEANNLLVHVNSFGGDSSIFRDKVRAYMKKYGVVDVHA